MRDYSKKFPLPKSNFWAEIPDRVLLLEKKLAGNVSPIATNGLALYSTNPLAGIPISNNIGNVLLGKDAGLNADVSYSNFLGYSAGRDATFGVYSNFLGQLAGYNATFGSNSNFFGQYAGMEATNANQSNFIGYAAGYLATGANNSNFFGQNAGYGATTANNCNFLGIEAGMNSTGNNVNAFGYQANKGGGLSGQTVFSNTSLKSYSNRAAAVAAITVPLGAVANNTYLYYNQTTFAIEAVRL